MKPFPVSQRFDERTLIPVLPIEAKRDFGILHVLLITGLSIAAWVVFVLLGWGAWAGFYNG